MTALSNRQRRLKQRKAKAAKRETPKPSTVEVTTVRRETLADVRADIEARQLLLVDKVVTEDAAAGLAVGRTGPVDLVGQAKRELAVDFVRTPYLPGVPLRAGGRDGLFALYKSKTLTDADMKAGLAFRLSYEGSAKGLGSCLGNAGEGGGGRKMAGLVRSAAELHRAYLLARLNQMERAVGEVLQDGRELHALRMIAGEGQTVREVAGPSGYARAQATAALVRALEAIAKVLRITGQ